MPQPLSRELRVTEDAVLETLVIDVVRATMEGYPPESVKERLATAFDAAQVTVAPERLEAATGSISRGELSQVELLKAADADERAPIRGAEPSILLGTLPELRQMRDEASAELAETVVENEPPTMAGKSPGLREQLLAIVSAATGDKSTRSTLRRARREIRRAGRKVELTAYIDQLDGVEHATREELQRQGVLPRQHAAKDPMSEPELV